MDYIKEQNLKFKTNLKKYKIFKTIIDECLNEKANFIIHLLVKEIKYDESYISEAENEGFIVSQARIIEDKEYISYSYIKHIDNEIDKLMLERDMIIKTFFNLKKRIRIKLMMIHPFIEYNNICVDIRYKIMSFLI